MSFGWSAGDIAAALKLAHSLYEALDSCSGAAREYREAVSFLKELIQTLEPLKAFAAWGAYPLHWKEITDRVSFIREPVESLLGDIASLEPSLGWAAKKGHRRHILPKLNWHLRISKRVLGLRNQIESHMRILDSLLQRLTLDIVFATQRSLPDVFLSVFQETIRPELITTLQNLTEAGACHRNSCLGMSSELYEKLQSQVHNLEQILADSKTAQLRLEACFNNGRQGSTGSHPTPIESSSALSGPGHSATDGQLTAISRVSQGFAEIDEAALRRSLRQVYFLVLLYLGDFLKNLFLLLSQFVQPSRQLAPPRLLAKLNITFLDVVGNPPLVLDYQVFNNFKIFGAFVQEQFRGIPLVERGQYLLMSMASNSVLDEVNWRRYIAPGSTIAMSALMLKRHKVEIGTERCPEPTCAGRWMASSTSGVWAKCPVCEREVFTVARKRTATSEMPGIPLIVSLPPPEAPATLPLRGAESNHANKPTILAGGGREKPRSKREELADEDMLIFKRIVRGVGVVEADAKPPPDRFEGDLNNLWVNDPKDSRYFLSIPDQFLSLTRALNRSHEDHMTAAAEPDFVAPSGDIRPCNILYFRNDDGKICLAISDSGLGQLHGMISRSQEAPRSVTYRAPESDLFDSIISPPSDIYSLGCVFLEHITWFLLGADAVEEFADYRITKDHHDFESDIFFTTLKGMQTATVKSEVRNWIEHLRRQPSCSEYLRQTLELIGTQMLEPDPYKRIKATVLEAKLRSFAE